MSTFTKKLLLISLTTVLGVASLATAHAADERGSAYLKQIGIVQGAANTGDLKLGDTINRAELMKIISKAATVKDITLDDFSNCLPDIHDQWFATFVCWAYDKGYVAGYPDGVFRAGNPVTHAEALKIITETLRLDYSRFEPVANSDLWYDIYVKNAISRNIVGKDIETKLAEQASRADVFDYLFRAMAIGSTGAYAFTDDMYTAFPAMNMYVERKERALSEGEEELLAIINSAAQKGIRPMTSSGSAMFSIGMSKEGEGSVQARVDVNTQESITGEKDRLDAMMLDVLMALDFRVDMDDTPVKARGKIGVNVAMSGTTMMYVRVNTLEVVELDAPVAAKIGVNQAVEMLRPYVGQWYAIDMATLPAEFALTPSQNPYARLDQVMRSMLSRTRTSFIQIAKGAENGQSTLVISFEPRAILDFTEVVGSEIEPGFNIYDVRSSMSDSLPFLQKLAEKTSMIITYDPASYMISTSRMLLEKLSHAFLEGPIVEMEGYTKDETQYPESVSIELPKESTPIEELFNELFAQPESAEAQPMQ